MNDHTTTAYTVVTKIVPDAVYTFHPDGRELFVSAVRPVHGAKGIWICRTAIGTEVFVRIDQLQLAEPVGKRQLIK